MLTTKSTLPKRLTVLSNNADTCGKKKKIKIKNQKSKIKRCHVDAYFGEQNLLFMADVALDGLDGAWQLHLVDGGCSGFQLVFAA